MPDGDCPSGQHWSSTAQIAGQWAAGACVDDPPPPAAVPNTAPVQTANAGTVFDHSAQNAQRPIWGSLSPVHI